MGVLTEEAAMVNGWNGNLISVANLQTAEIRFFELGVGWIVLNQ